MGYIVVQVDLRGSIRGLMVSKMGPRVSKMVKAGFKVIQDNPRQYQGLVAFNFVTS